MLDLPPSCLNALGRDAPIDLEIGQDLRERNDVRVRQLQLVCVAFGPQVEDLRKSASLAIDPGMYIAGAHRRGYDQAHRFEITPSSGRLAQRVYPHARVTVDEDGCDRGATCIQSNSAVRQCRQHRVRQLPATYDGDARKAREVPSGKRPVRARAEPGEVLRANRFRVSQHALTERLKGAPPAALIAQARHECTELTHHLRLADHRRVEAAHDLEQKPIGIRAAEHRVTGTERVGSEMLGKQERDLAQAGLPGEALGQSHRKLPAVPSMQDDHRLQHAAMIENEYSQSVTVLSRRNCSTRAANEAVDSGPVAHNRAQIGILIAQLGTPAAPTSGAVRQYLRQFLSDRRVVEANRLAWWFVLNFIVLARRPKHSAALYRRIWTDEGSPLLAISRALVHALAAELVLRTSADIRIGLGMRYGDPSIASGIEELIDSGVDRLLLFPMYPQYAGATTGSTYEEVFRVLSGRRFMPALRIVPPYYDHPAYIDALAASVRQTLASLEQAPERFLLSFHGIPRRYVAAGDPYPLHCQATAQALAGHLAWGEDDYVLSYQSRFGREEWLQPYTDETLARIAQCGITRLVVVCPGFTADCLETIDEIGRIGSEQFRAAGGESLHLVPCLNDRSPWVAAMTRIALEQLQGWVPS